MGASRPATDPYLACSFADLQHECCTGQLDDNDCNDFSPAGRCAVRLFDMQRSHAQSLDAIPAQRMQWLLQVAAGCSAALCMLHTRLTASAWPVFASAESCP